MKIDISGGREPISTDPVDVTKVCKAAIEAVVLIVEDNEDYSKGRALAIQLGLSNDERRWLQTILKSAPVKGTRKTYFGAFKEHMALEREAIK